LKKEGRKKEFISRQRQSNIGYFRDITLSGSVESIDYRAEGCLF